MTCKPNNIVARFVYATPRNVPEVIVKGGATYRVVMDHRGSVRLVVDAVTGSVAQRLDYDEFWRVLVDTNPGFQPFGFAGGLYDAETGLVRFGVRDYDAETGRWMSRDPLLFGGGDANLYAYVLGDPLNFVDPEGKWADAIPWGQVGFGVGALGALAPVLPGVGIVGICVIIAVSLESDAPTDARATTDFPDFGEGEESRDCKKIKQACINLCADMTFDHGVSEPYFTRCVRACLEANDC